MLDVNFFLNLVETWGYLGAFFSGFLSTFTLFLPSPTFVVVALLATKLNPIVLGLVGGSGAAIGEMIGYYIGYGIGRGAEKAKSRYKKIIDRIEKSVEKYHPDVVIFIFAAAPILPFDAVGMFCGAIKYNTKRFFIVMFFGKIVKYLTIALIGYYGLNSIIGFLDGG